MGCHCEGTKRLKQSQKRRDCHPFASLRASAYLVARNDNETTFVSFAIITTRRLDGVSHASTGPGIGGRRGVPSVELQLRQLSRSALRVPPGKGKDSILDRRQR